MFDFFKNIISNGGKNAMTDEDIILAEIERFKTSGKRKQMITGEKYYAGEHDILKRKRTAIGAGGELLELENLPNNHIVDNQYKKMVDQKNNYLLGQPFSLQTDNELYSKVLQKVFNRRFMRTLKNIGEDSLNAGIGWMYIYYDERGHLTFKRFKPYEIIPGWQDAEHTNLDYVIRLYELTAYEGKKEIIVERVEVYRLDGVSYYELQGNILVPVEPYHQNYLWLEDTGFNWEKIPLIPFKYNAKEIPLIKTLKSLQDGLNFIVSNFLNHTEEDARNTILVLVNYDGQDLGEFRQNLATYGAVKVRTLEGAPGDLKTLQIEVNPENYKLILELFKKAIIENAMGYDAKDDRLAGNPNQMNIQSMYSDIDLDANGMEMEYQASFEELLWFVNVHLANSKQGDFENEDVEIIFNRDMLISETDIIDNIGKSVGLLSTETLIAQHPWINDPFAELERVNKQREDEANPYPGAFSGGEVNEE